MRGERAAVLRAVQRERAEIVDHAVVLAAERDRAVLVVRQADECPTAELAAVLTQLAGREVEAVFDDEDRLQSAAQIFRTAQRAKQIDSGRKGAVLIASRQARADDRIMRLPFPYPPRGGCR